MCGYQSAGLCALDGTHSPFRQLDDCIFLQRCRVISYLLKSHAAVMLTADKVEHFAVNLRLLLQELASQWHC